MIQIKNISKTFYKENGAFKALDNVSIALEKGDIVGIIGSSGAGKSTLIRCVNLLEKPDEGEIIVNNRNLLALNNKSLSAEREKIGMIFQHFNLLSSKTVFDNVALPLELTGKDKITIRKRVVELLTLVGLGDKIYEYPKNLSGGQKQRVAIARALANKPHVLLCDEATSALDPVTTGAILELLKEINQTLKITILLITHEMEVVKSICNRIAVLDTGKIVIQGAFEDVVASGHSIVQQFISKKKITIPGYLKDQLRQSAAEGLFPLLEIELNNAVSLETIIDFSRHYYHVPVKILKADIETVGELSFGKSLLILQGQEAANENVMGYLDQNNIKNNIRGYV